MSRTPGYEQIAELLRTRIRDASLTEGTVLLEGALAGIFGASRSPVRQALELLCAEGLVSRFDGRGLVVGDGTAPLRREPLDEASFGARPVKLTRAWGWQRPYAGVEREVTLRCALGVFEVNELELAARLGIGRTVAHEVLLRIAAIGLIRKDSRARWVTVPLDDRRVADLYELRRLLEPAGVAGAVGRIPQPTLRGMLARLEAAADAYPAVEAGLLDRLEQDLHVDLIGHGGNAELPEALRRTRCIIISSKHLLGSVVSLPDGDPFLEEHQAVLRAAVAGQAAQAGRAMLAHLTAAEQKVTARLQAARARADLPPLPYFTPLPPV